MPFKEPEFEEKEGDEIPGSSSFIYRLNRFRRPEEFKAYPDWKSTPPQDDPDVGFNKDKRIDELEEKLRNAKNYVEKDKQLADSKIERLGKELIEKDKEIAKLQHDLTAKGMRADRFETRNKKVIIFLRDHGGHSESCFWADLCASGRVGEHDNESELCNCGWDYIQRSFDSESPVAEQMALDDIYGIIDKYDLAE